MICWFVVMFLSGDCGASKCELQQLTRARMLSAAKADGVVGNKEDDESIARALQYHGEDRTNLDIAENRIPFSVHEVVPLTISSANSCDVFESLREECIAVLKQSKETFWVGSDWKYSFDDSKFATDGKDEIRKQSLCQLEDFALMIFRYHTQSLADSGVTIDPSTSGAEWWIQVKNVHDDSSTEDVQKETQDSPYAESDGDHTICLHYDKDEDAAEKWAVGLFPALSTVTYLSEATMSASSETGACPQPTVIFNTTANDIVGSPISDVYLSFPRIGKHVAFDGNMLHGAPANRSLCTWYSPQGHSVKKSSTLSDKLQAEKENKTTLRVTFLVNIWLNHHPLGVKILDEGVANGLRSCPDNSLPTAVTSTLASNMAGLQVSFTPPVPPTPATGSCTSTNALKENVVGGEHDVELCVPLTTLVSLQAHGEVSTHSVVIKSDDVFCEEREEDRDEGLTEGDVLLRGGYEQLCLPFISSKGDDPLMSDKENDLHVDENDKVNDDDNGEGDEYDDDDDENEEEAGLIVRMILPPCPSNIPPHAASGDIAVDSFHFVYCDELCSPALEYDYDDYDEDDDDDEEDDDDDEDDDEQ